MKEFKGQTRQRGFLVTPGAPEIGIADIGNTAVHRSPRRLMAAIAAITVLLVTVVVSVLPGDAEASDFVDTSVEFQFWAAVNEARADARLQPLALQMPLSVNAQRVLDEALADDGAVKSDEGQLETIPDAVTGTVESVGVAMCCGDIGFPTISDHIDSFLHHGTSPLLSSDYTHVGFGTATAVDHPEREGYFHVLVHLVAIGDDGPTCGDKDVTILGTDGADMIVGTSGADVIFGGGSDDHIVGLDGADTLCGGGGHDLIEGGDGDDVAFGQGGADSIRLGDGDDLAYGGPGYDSLYGGVGHDNLQGGGGDDRLIGSDGVDYLYGQFGNDYLDGGLNDDQMYGAHGDDRMFGGLGDDRMQGASGNDTIDGGPGDDFLFGQDDNDLLSGSEGDDTLYAAAGDDRVFGGDGNDHIEGGSGDDELRGNAGVDELFGQLGDDIVDGGDDEDSCYDAMGENTVIDCP